MGLIVISAPSGGGKTTLCKLLMKEFPNLVRSVSYTTRKPRGNEVDGQSYFFIEVEKFKNKIMNDEFAEWAIVHGNYYGTLKTTLEENLAANRPVLLDIDVQGAESLKKIYSTRCVTCFISPPSLEVLKSRLESRATDPPRIIKDRIRNASEELRRQSEFDYVIINNELDQAFRELKEIVAKLLSEGPVNHYG